MIKQLFAAWISVLLVSDVAAYRDTTAANDAIKAAQLLEVQADDFVVGANNAPVKIFEYSSLSCTHCAVFHDKVFTPLKQNYIDKGKVQYVFRAFPSNDPSLKAVLLAQCAGHDKYLHFIDSLFASQNMWAFTTEYEKALISIGKLSGLTDEKIKDCLYNSQVVDAVLSKAYEAAKTLNITGTPTMFIDGEMVVGEQSYEKFTAIIDKHLAK